MAPPEELLPAFRQAALSVTNLYKSAANYHDSIRQTGYQDALEDLLKFLDKENIGLQDGEGWRVREWLASKYDVSHLQQSEAEDDDMPEQDQTQRDSSPEKPAAEDERIRTTTIQVAPATPVQSHPSDHVQQPSQPVFNFSHGSDNSMQEDELPSSSNDTIRASSSRVDTGNRPVRSLKSIPRHPTRSVNRQTLQTVTSKRKMPFPDIPEFWDFEKKDNFDGGNASGSGSGGGGVGSKRSRIV